MEKLGEVFDAICLLQPTNPLRRAEDIDACIELLEASGADSVVSVLPVPPEYNPHWVYFEDRNGELRLATGEDQPIARRQDLPKAYHRDGSVYVTNCRVLRLGNLYGSNVRGHVLEHIHQVNIDTPDDWAKASALLAS